MQGKTCSLCGVTLAVSEWEAAIVAHTTKRKTIAVRAYCPVCKGAFSMVSYESLPIVEMPEPKNGNATNPALPVYLKVTYIFSQSLTPENFHRNKGRPIVSVTSCPQKGEYVCVVRFAPSHTPQDIKQALARSGLTPLEDLPLSVPVSSCGTQNKPS